MTGETLRHAAVMLGAGIGIPVLAALNAQLGQRIGSPAAAAVILFLIAFAAAVPVTALTGGGPALARLPGQPPQLFAAGLLVAFYVLSVTWVAPRFGVGNAILCVLFGQMISSAVIDHFALFGAMRQPLTGVRLAGLGAMAAGLLMARSG
jgi:transporter family-2 protein